MAQKGNAEADLNYVLRVLVHTQAIEVDWYGVAGVTKGPDQDRGPANRRLVYICFPLLCLCNHLSSTYDIRPLLLIFDLLPTAQRLSLSTALFRTIQIYHNSL